MELTHNVNLFCEERKKIIHMLLSPLFFFRGRGEIGFILIILTKRDRVRKEIEEQKKKKEDFSAFRLFILKINSKKILMEKKRRSALIFAYFL